MPKNFVSYDNAISLMTGVNNKKVGKSDLTDIFATGTTNNTGSEISSGIYFYLNDELVKAIDDIAVGDTFTEDTNYEVVNGVLNEETSTGGGHKIEDAAGNVLQQQDTMQFLGGIKATNDPQNGKTLVDDSPTLVTWEVWNAMTPEQRAAIPKAQITNVPGADGTISAEFFTLLWENPSPTSSFVAQNITLASADYDFLLIEFSFIYSPISVKNVIAPKGYKIYLDAADATSSGARGVYREISYNTDTSLSVGQARVATGTTTASYNDAYQIPLAIYGFKKTLSLNFSAIASDVSTLASKCMLEDGETSVEEKLEEFDSIFDNPSKMIIKCIKDGGVSFNSQGIAEIGTGRNDWKWYTAIFNAKSSAYINYQFPVSCYSNLVGIYNASLVNQTIQATITIIGEIN